MTRNKTPLAPFAAYGAASVVLVITPAHATASTLLQPESLFSLCLAGMAGVRPAAFWSSWSFAPEILVPLVLLALAYGAGMRLQRRRGQSEKLMTDTALFMSGIVLLVIALMSPLCRMAATLAWAHMVQHVILVALAPPLLVLGARPLTGLFPRSEKGARSHIRQLASPASGPAIGGALYGAAIWFWHVPRFYEAALLSVPMHLAMYASLIACALLFWRGVINSGRMPGESAGVAIVVLLVTLLHTGLLGALLTFSRRLWYPLMAPGGALWGLTPLEDQQLAGLIMWVPMGVLYLIAALALAAVALGRMSAASGDQAEARP